MKLKYPIERLSIGSSLFIPYRRNNRGCFYNRAERYGVKVTCRKAGDFLEIRRVA